ncbi:hypothetical protein [Paenibacillus sp. GCM10012303]|uniref:hypothetical protein n=1 Tax=Paenibacillus sp. GCM10012303 TaxID=3317340 RepID=UPI003622C1C6
MKKIGMTISVLSLLFSLLLGCGSGKSESASPNIMVAAGDLDDNFHSLEEIESKAETILEIRVLDNQQTIVYGDIPFTISRAVVLSSLKGNIHEGEEINILETGGIYKPVSKEGKGFLPEVDYAFNGIPVMKSGEHLVTFLYKYEGPIAKNVFMPLGVYQGKFKVQDNGKIEQQAPKENKIITNFTDLGAFKGKVKEMVK